jgi:hypothetical protein
MMKSPDSIRPLKINYARMKQGKIAWFTICALLQATIVLAQTDTSLVRKNDSAVVRKDSLPQRQHIAVFTPLYLDSAFDAKGNYRFDKSFPKYMHAGLEYWHGVQLALDSLKKEGVGVDVHVYDTRSAKKKFESLLTGEELKKMNLFIGHVTINEAAQLARLANSNGIPFINATLPNDADVTNNPNYVLLNSTLMTHCAGIYKFLQRNFALSNIIVFTKKGTQEDRLRQYFTEVEKNTSSVPLKLKYITLNPGFTPEQVKKYLDSNSTNVCLVASLDLNFAQTLCQQLAGWSNSYASTVVGMPNWEAIDFEKSLYKGIEVYYSTTIHIDPVHKIASGVFNRFKNEYYSRPTDMVFRGYESLYHFAHLLKLYNENLNSSLGDKKYMIFTEYDIQPILNKTTQTLDYFENKKLYIVRKVDGVVKAVY